jgi:TatD DNase family protein
MVFVDVHAHLDFKQFDTDREQLIKQLKEQNIITLTNTLNPENYHYTKSLFSQHSHIHVLPGLYPQDAENISEQEFQHYLSYLRSHSSEFIAIGEVGLDRKNTTDPKLWELQEQRLRALIELGIELDKPVILHTRKAEEHVLNILEEYIEKTGFRKFNLHCFSGKKRLIKKIIQLKIYCSIPLILLNTQSFQILVEELPIKQLLVETDSPFLHPNKERNSPLNVPLIYEKIAQIKGLDSLEIQHIIYRNYQKFIL